MIFISKVPLQKPLCDCIFGRSWSYKVNIDHVIPSVLFSILAPTHLCKFQSTYFLFLFNFAPFHTELWRINREVYYFRKYCVERLISSSPIRSLAKSYLTPFLRNSGIYYYFLFFFIAFILLLFFHEQPQCVFSGAWKHAK